MNGWEVQERCWENVALLWLHQREKVLFLHLNIYKYTLLQIHLTASHRGQSMWHLKQNPRDVLSTWHVDLKSSCTIKMRLRNLHCPSVCSVCSKRSKCSRNWAKYISFVSCSCPPRSSAGRRLFSDVEGRVVWKVYGVSIIWALRWQPWYPQRWRTNSPDFLSSLHPFCAWEKHPLAACGQQTWTAAKALDPVAKLV